MPIVMEMATTTMKMTMTTVKMVAGVECWLMVALMMQAVGTMNTGMCCSAGEIIFSQYKMGARWRLCGGGVGQGGQ